MTKHHTGGLTIRPDDGFACGGHELPVGCVSGLGTFELLKVACTLHGDFHFHSLVHGERLGLSGGGDAVLTHHVGKVGGSSRGQGQGADGQYGQLGLSPHDGEEALTLLQHNLARHVGITLAERSEGACVIHCAPGLAFGVGGGGAHGLVMHHGQHTLERRLEIAHLHVHCAHLRRAHGVHAAGQENLDGGLDGLVHVAVLDIGVPEHTEIHGLLAPADGTLRNYGQGGHLNDLGAAGVVLDFQPGETHFARSIGDNLERIYLHGGAVGIQRVGSGVVLHDFHRGVRDRRALLNHEQILADVGIHEVKCYLLAGHGNIHRPDRYNFGHGQTADAAE